MSVLGRPPLTSLISEYSCPFGKDFNDKTNEKWLNIHPGGYYNLLNAYEVEEGAANMLFLSYHMGHNIEASYKMGKALGYNCLPSQTELYKELDDIYHSIINKYWYHEYIYKIYCIFITFIVIILRIYFLYSPTILIQFILALATISYGCCVLHARGHSGRYFIFSEKYEFGEKCINILFNIIECLVFMYPMNVYIQTHNKSHHLYTNSTEDHSLWRTYPFLKYHKNYKNKSFHKYQYFYVTFLICFGGLMVYPKMIKNKITKQAIPTKWQCIIYTFCHISLFYFIPYYIHGSNAVILAVFARSIGGFFVVLLFHASHVNDNIPFVNYKDNLFENYDKWIKNQIETAMNWAPSSYLYTLYCGGVNNQIEHHIAPSICPIFHCFAAEYIEKLCKKQNIKYNKLGNWFQFVYGYHKQLYKLGNQNQFFCK